MHHIEWRFVLENDHYVIEVYETDTKNIYYKKLIQISVDNVIRKFFKAMINEFFSL